MLLSLPALAEKTVTTGYDEASGFRYKSSTWTAKGTKFQHVTYYNGDGQVNHQVRYAKPVDGKGKDTVRYAFYGAPGYKTKGPIWTANGTTFTTRTNYAPDGSKDVERLASGKRRFWAKGAFYVPGQMVEEKLWRFGKAVVGVVKTTQPDGTTAVRRTGGSTLPQVTMPQF
jgi:hypothetical protein